MGTLVWVLLSKGKPKQPNNAQQSGFDALALHKKRRNKKNKRKIDGEIATTENEVDSTKKDSADHVENGTESNDNVANNDGNDKNTVSQLETSSLNQSRKEFFLRARVVTDDEPIAEKAGDSKQSSATKHNERRILVRYSRGATYRVRAYNLIAILEPSVHNTPTSTQSTTPTATAALIPPMVVVVPETNIYRRVAKVHTTPEDSFMEIGCDYGITVDKIYKSLEEAGDVPKVWPAEKKSDADVNVVAVENGKEEGDCKRVSCLGVDRSKESIDIANERYPKCKFALANVLLPEEMASIRTLCETKLTNSAPTVICIDINGNREIAGVLECLDMVMKEQWKVQPRMIIVKSRFLYWELKNGGGC